MSQEILTYFMSINIPIQEIYGMSETAGVCVRERDRERVRERERKRERVCVGV